ncbi:hypothetical protein [Proteus terrae]|nr:hypothetical protein [Proteus terrae]
MPNALLAIEAYFGVVGATEIIPALKITPTNKEIIYVIKFTINIFNSNFL